jgi:hypothetical protein
LLDLRLMKLPSFGLSVVAGSLTRITGGALPFLLPMMLQLGFRLSPGTSGLITLSAAGGAVLMKAAGPRILRQWGFRNVLIWNGVLATLCLMSAALFTVAWPVWAIFTVMLVGGFFQSLQFTAYNTVAYADTTAAQASGATSFYATFQQLMLSAGICLAASVLAAARDFNHHATPTLSDFSVTWLVVGLITLTAAPICALLPKNVGDDMAGRG